MGKWKEFIEQVVPLQSDREYLKEWFKNAKNGIKNEKGLALFSSGISGKTTLVKTIFRALEMDEFVVFDPPTGTSIPEKAKVIINGYDKSYKSNYIRFMIDKLDINVVVLLNTASDDILKRCHTIVMPRIDIELREMYQELISDKESIKRWFFTE